MVGQAAVLIVAIIVGSIVVANLQRRLSGAPSATASPRATSAPPDALSALPFNCVSSAGLGIGPAPKVAYVDAVRVGTQAGFDRVTIEFVDGPPAETTLSTQNGAQFKQGASGQTVTLNGQYGALVTLHSADSHARYDGPTDIKTGFPVVLQLYKVQDFEGTVQWAVGLAQRPCYRFAFLDNPTRLVIDFRASTTTT